MARFVKYSRLLQPFCAPIAVLLVFLLSFGMVFRVGAAVALASERDEANHGESAADSQALPLTEGEDGLASLTVQKAKDGSEESVSSGSGGSKSKDGDSKGSQQGGSKSDNPKQGDDDTDDGKGGDGGAGKDGGDKGEDDDEDKGEARKEIDQGANYSQDTLVITGVYDYGYESEPYYEPISSDEGTFEYKDAFGAGGYFIADGYFVEGEEYQMYSEQHGQVKVVGNGAYFESFMEEMNITDLSKIEEIKFTSYDGESVSRTWSDLTSGGKKPFIAVESYVSALDDGSAADGEPELLENTRYRVLFQDEAESLSEAICDADKLSYIKEIEINPHCQQSQSQLDAPNFLPSIEYNPTAFGHEATLNCVLLDFNGEPLDKGWLEVYECEYTWSESDDKGNPLATKKKGRESDYRLVTDESTIGHYFVVVVSSEGYKDIASDPVMISEDFSVSLSYEAPLAGEFAKLEADVHPKDGVDSKKLKYTWEFSRDGGKKWDPLPDEYQGSATLSLQADPSFDLTKGSDAWREDTELACIRVVVGGFPGDKTTRESIPQVLKLASTEDEGESGRTQDGEGEAGESDEDVRERDSDPETVLPRVPQDPKDDESGPVEDGAGLDPVSGEAPADLQEAEELAPGIRMVPISEPEVLEIKSEVSQENPLAPILFLLCSGSVVAGCATSLVSFRRQLGSSDQEGGSPL